MTVKTARIWVACILTFFCALLTAGFLYIRWATYEPPLDDLLARIPPMKVVAPTNDSPELLESLNHIDAGKSDSEIFAIDEALKKLPNLAARRTYLVEHKDEVIKTCEARRARLDVLLKLATYDEVFDPPSPVFSAESWNDFRVPTFRGISNDVKSQIFLADVGLAREDRTELGRLIDLYAMFHNWRNNQWCLISGIVCFSSTKLVDNYLQSLLENGELQASEAERVIRILSNAYAARNILRDHLVCDTRHWVSMLQYTDSHPDAFFGPRAKIESFIALKLGLWNPKLTIHEYVTAELIIIGMMDEDRFAEAQVFNDNWLKSLNKKQIYRNRVGLRILRVVLSKFKLDAFPKIDEREAAFLKQVKALLPADAPSQ